jgi:hypothetical protein
LFVFLWRKISNTPTPTPHPPFFKQVSALTGASVDALFAALFAQALARTPGVPQAAVAAALGAADAAAAAAAAGGGGGGGSDDVGAEDQCAGE